MTDTEKIKQLEQKIIKLKRDNGLLKSKNNIIHTLLSSINRVIIKDRSLFLIEEKELLKALNDIKLLGGK